MGVQLKSLGMQKERAHNKLSNYFCYAKQISSLEECIH